MNKEIRRPFSYLLLQQRLATDVINASLSASDVYELNADKGFFLPEVRTHLNYFGHASLVSLTRLATEAITWGEMTQNNRHYAV